MSTSAEPLVWERFENHDITDQILGEAARLFSENYGIWGPLAEQNFGPSAKKGQSASSLVQTKDKLLTGRIGKRVRMGVKTLKSQCLPAGTRNIYVRVQIDGELAGNVFASRWTHRGRKICWISQLVVGNAFRRQGLATKLLFHLRDGGSDWNFGILSSHPAAIRAALRAFGSGLESVDLELTREHAHDVLQSAPISYVKNAVLRGSLFESVQDSTVSSAYTNFWVDHQEPLDALAVAREEGKPWPFGELLEGHEFLVVISRDNIHSSS